MTPEKVNFGTIGLSPNLLLAAKTKPKQDSVSLSKLSLQTDKAGKEAETVQPKNGDRYVLGRDPGGKLTLQKE